MKIFRRFLKMVGCPIDEADRAQGLKDYTGVEDLRHLDRRGGDC